MNFKHYILFFIFTTLGFTSLLYNMEEPPKKKLHSTVSTSDEEDYPPFQQDVPILQDLCIMKIFLPHFLPFKAQCYNFIEKNEEPDSKKTDEYKDFFFKSCYVKMLQITGPYNRLPYKIKSGIKKILPSSLQNSSSQRDELQRNYIRCMNNTIQELFKLFNVLPEDLITKIINSPFDCCDNSLTHLIFMYGTQDQIKSLLKRTFISLNFVATNKMGQSIFMVAAKNEDPHVIEELITYLESLSTPQPSNWRRILLEEGDAKDNCLLAYLLHNKETSLQFFQKLIEKIVPDHDTEQLKAIIIQNTNTRHQNLIYLSLYNPTIFLWLTTIFPTIFKETLLKQMKLERRRPQKTILHKATQLGNAEAVKFLLDQVQDNPPMLKACLNKKVTDKGKRLLYYAFKSNSLKTCRLFENYFNELLMRDERNKHYLNALIKIQDDKLIEFLLPYFSGKIDLNDTDMSEKSILHKATKHSNNRSIFEFLLNNNNNKDGQSIDKNISDNIGNTPLHNAAMYGNLIAIEVLCDPYLNDTPIELDAENCCNLTPLGSAIFNGQWNAYILLLEKGSMY